MSGITEVHKSAAEGRQGQKTRGVKGYRPGSDAGVQPRITHERPVVHALDGRG
jgi:hypothetical protein